MSHKPLAIEQVCLSRGISEPAFGPTEETLFYVSLADGRRSIVRQSTRTGLAQIVTTGPEPRGSIGYGGGIFDVRGETLVYAAGDNRLHALQLAGGRQWPVSPPCEGVASPQISPCGRYVVFLSEQERTCNVCLTAIDGKSLPVKLSADPWYAFNPVFSPDGSRIAWQEWDEMHMPWHEARLVVARLAKPTGVCSESWQMLPLDPTSIARPLTSYASPQFSPDGRNLAFTSDETGWRSLWVGSAGGNNAVRMNTGEGEIGHPDWVPGLCSFRWSAEGDALYAVRRSQSRDTLIRVDFSSGRVTELESGWSEIRGLQVSGKSLIFVGSSPTVPPSLISMELATGREDVRATSGAGLLHPLSLSSPEVLSWNTTKNSRVWGILYRSHPAEKGKKQGPLLVYVHGGPTSESSLRWDPQAQYFATRGWHYLIVNYRGSSGFGREYQEALNGQWGVLDCEDACTGAIHLINRGIADPKRVAITGGSAGGYTTLVALTRQEDFWAAGISLYGVADLFELKLGSHRFEVNYEDTLIGRLPESGPLWKERSPLHRAGKVRAPVLLFHGTEDKAVPHRQSVDFADAVRRKGGVAELVSYQGEGHGFLREANRRDLIEKMEQFLYKYVICKQG